MLTENEKFGEDVSHPHNALTLVQDVAWKTLESMCWLDTLNADDVCIVVFGWNRWGDAKPLPSLGLLE